MFSIWKKLGGTTIFITFVCIFFIVCDYLLMKRINVLFIVLLLMYLWLDIRNIIWYFVLKKRGVILENVPYFIELRNVNNKKKKFFLVKYITEDGSEVKLYGDRFIKNVDNLADKGKVNLLVDPKNYRNYFMSFETITK